MPPREVAQEDLEPGKRYYIITNLGFMRRRPDNIRQTNYTDPVLGPIVCNKWVGTFMETIRNPAIISSHFRDVDCMGTPWRWNGNEFTEYRDSVIHIGLKQFNSYYNQNQIIEHYFHKFYEAFETSDENSVNQIIRKQLPFFSWSMATKPNTTGGRRHYSRKNKKKRQKKRRNTKSKKYRK